MTAPRLAVTLTVDELRSLVRDEVRRELGILKASDESADVLTREQAAKLLHVEAHTVTRWVKARGLPGHRLAGGEWRFRRSALLRWLDQHKA